MKIRRDIGQEVDLLRRWVLASGRDVLATTRGSFVSVEGRAGVWVFVALWALGRWAGGPWNVWGRELGGEILPVVRTWYAGEMVLCQAGILAAHILLGVLWGGAIKNAWGLAGTVWPAALAERFRSWVVGAATGGLILIAHTAFLLRDVARHPALYQETFLDRGGFLAWAQRFSLHTLSGMGGTAVLWFVGLLAGAAIVRLVHRLVLWFLNFSRPTRVAIGVLGGTVALFACGIRFVVWTQAGRNEGPNLLLISIDGLRGERGLEEKERPPSAASRLVRRAGVKGRLVPPSVDFSSTMATALTGRSPLSHGIRHGFPSAQELSRDFNSLPAFVQGNGWATWLLADGPELFLDRMGKEFAVSRVPSSALPVRIARRQWERSPHVLPYLSGRAGRWFPPLRGSPFLTDPALLASEAADAMDALQREPKFFLWVHFSSLSPLSAISSPRGAAKLGQKNPAFYRRPGDGRTERLLTDAERTLLRDIYDENRQDTWMALDTLLNALANHRLAGNTAVLLWSPRAHLLTEEEEGEARSLLGPAFFDVPFLAAAAPSQGGGRRFGAGGRTMDLAPTAARLLGLTVPFAWEGSSLLEGIPEGEAGIFYWETDTPFVEANHPFRIPPLIRLLQEDRDSPGHLRLDPAWEDPVLLFRDRAIHMGDERLFYRPGITGVSFDYEKQNDPSPPAKNAALARARKARLKEIREIFYRYLSHESEWRPQNDFWIPEAFLREEPGEAVRGN
jgi:hypothetical protein